MNRQELLLQLSEGVKEVVSSSLNRQGVKDGEFKICLAEDEIWPDVVLVVIVSPEISIKVFGSLMEDLRTYFLLREYSDGASEMGEDEDDEGWLVIGWPIEKQRLELN